MKIGNYYERASLETGGNSGVFVSTTSGEVSEEG